MQRQFRRVTPASDVTRKAKSMTNAGTSAASGVVSGARGGHPRDSNAAGGECGLSRSRSRGRAMLRQGSRSSFVCDRWCCTRRRRLPDRGHRSWQFFELLTTDLTRYLRRQTTTKGLTGILHVCNLSKRCVGAGNFAGADFREERRRLRKRDSGGPFSRGGGLTADT